MARTRRQEFHLDDAGKPECWNGSLIQSPKAVLHSDMFAECAEQCLIHLLNLKAELLGKILAESLSLRMEESQEPFA